MKKIILAASLLVMSLATFACSVCEKQQPKILRGITHGAGPQSNWDYLIISVTAIIVLATLFFSVKWLAKPGEKSPAHIKQLILNIG
jgi:hypothetical protein